MIEITTTQIKYFLAIIEYGGFSAAADEMFISQSSLSKQIKSLESEVGLALFCRSNNKVSLTPGGELFFKYGEMFLKSYTEMLTKMTYYRKETAAEVIHLGSLPLLQEYHLGKQLAHFQDIMHNIQIDITEANQRELLHLLNTKKIDLAILRLDHLNKDHYDFFPITEDHFMIVCSKQTAKQIGKEVGSLSTLKKYPFVIMSSDSDIYHLCMEQFEQAGFYPNIAFTSSRHFPLLDMVDENLGITLLPQNMLNRKLFPDIVCIPFKEAVSTSIGFVRLADSEIPHSANMLYEYFFDCNAPSTFCTD